jgi:hypothetical protein
MFTDVILFQYTKERLASGYVYSKVTRVRVPFISHLFIGRHENEK